MRNPDDISLDEIFASMIAEQERSLVDNGPNISKKRNVPKTNKNRGNSGDITLEEIYASMEARNKKFDAVYVDIFYHEIFSDELARYTLVKPFEVDSQITKGSVIRYIEGTTKETAKISCASLVIKAVFTDGIEEGKILDHFLLTTVYNGEKIWKIFPSNYYIFQYLPSIGDQKFAISLRKIEAKKGKNTKEIKVTLQERRKILKNIGMTDKEIKKNMVLNERIDKILESNENKKLSYGNIRVNQENLNDVLNMIMQQDDNNGKK